jgi:stage II sporulation protein AA (anti-sigma F factor antagonist)
MPLSCQTERRPLTARVSGEIDHHAARHLMRELDRAIESRSPLTLVLDLGGVSFMDSSGIAVLLRAWRHMGRLGGTMRVIHTPPQAKKVFQAAALERLIQFE